MNSKVPYRGKDLPSLRALGTQDDVVQGIVLKVEVRDLAFMLATFPSYQAFVETLIQHFHSLLPRHYIDIRAEPTVADASDGRLRIVLRGDSALSDLTKGLADALAHVVFPLSLSWEASIIPLIPPGPRALVV